MSNIALTFISVALCNILAVEIVKTYNCQLLGSHKQDRTSSLMSEHPRLCGQIKYGPQLEILCCQVDFSPCAAVLF